MINQAVLFTKPVHHLTFDLTSEELEQFTETYFEEKGFRFVLSRRIAGEELAARQILRHHYLMYSKGSYGDVKISESGRAKFKETFGKDWETEVEEGRIMGNPQLLEARSINAEELFTYWNHLFQSGQTHKIQDGLIVGWIGAMECYCINAFYPAIEASFYHPDNWMNYHVVEFYPSIISWNHFRKQELGETDCSKAAPESFRGQLYSKYPVPFSGRDNFVHGSAGPLEGLVERVVHESDFEMTTNPIGAYLSGRGVTLNAFKDWKNRQSIAVLGDLFNTTEEKNTAEILQTLDKLFPVGN